MRSFLPPAPPTVTKPRVRPRPVFRLPEDADKRAMVIAVCATVLLHVVVFFALPDRFGSDLDGQFAPEHLGVENKTFNIELTPDEFPLLKPKQKDPFKFVETNPDAPENIPDKTDNFGAQNQQAAQEKPPTKDGGDRPEMEGKKDLEPSQIVDGNLAPKTEILPLPPPPTPEAPQEEKNEQTPAQEKNPLQGNEKYVGENDKTFGTNIAKASPRAENLDKKIEGAPDATKPDGVGVAQSKAAHAVVPRERPKLDKRARPALFAENRIGTSNIGPVGVDARWSNYGEYLQKLIETVQLQWDKLVAQSRSYPTPGSVVTVKFIINTNGDISRVVSVESGLSGQQAERNCVSAITIPAPYGKWTEDMVAMLGEQQEMTFSFHYQ